MSIERVHGSLFSAPKGSILVLACDCDGTWARGIASEFATHFPWAFEQCMAACEMGFTAKRALVFEDEGHHVACLMVSEGCGPGKSPPSEIASYTQAALLDLRAQLELYPAGTIVCSGPLSDGLFQGVVTSTLIDAIFEGETWFEFDCQVDEYPIGPMKRYLR